jgi:hypothetical protein
MVDGQSTCKKISVCSIRVHLAVTLRPLTYQATFDQISPSIAILSVKTTHHHEECMH